MKALVYVEIDIPYCILEYGIGDCSAVLGVDSEHKCFNTRATCPVLQDYSPELVTLRFAYDCGYLPADIPAFPSLVDEPSYTPATIDLGKTMGQRASITMRFKDHPHNDTGSGFDKYWDERLYNALAQGTFWGKLRARHPSLFGMNARLIRGYLGQDITEMDTEHFIIQSFDGPSNGFYSITAKDPLKLADDDRAQAPLMSQGFLRNAIDDNDTTLLLSPTGIGPAEYPTSGWVAIGGKEIVEFTRDGGSGNDANVISLNHFDGADNATSSADVNLKGTNRVWSFSGNAKLTTADFKFGTASLTLDGVGDFVTTADHADFTLGSDDFEVDMWFKNTAASGVLQYLAGQAVSGLTAATSAWFISRNTSNQMAFNVAVGSSWITLTSGATTITDTTTWHHIKVYREGDNLYMHLDGVQVGTIAISGAVNNSAANVSIGRAGAHTTNTWSGLVDEFRMSTGVSRSDELLPTAAYNTLDVDQLNIVRAQYNTEAISHEAQDRVQLCLRFFGEYPSAIIQTLMTEYAGIDDAWIPFDDWTTEVQVFLQRVYTTLIAEPTSVRKLINELIEQSALGVWWDSRNQQIRLQVLRAIPTGAITITDQVYEKQSLSVQDQPDKKITQVWCYYGQINPLRKVDDTDNYRSAILDIDQDAQLEIGTAGIHKIYSRWISAGGRLTAERLCALQIARYSRAPRKVKFKQYKHNQQQINLGDGARISSPEVQDAFGARELLPIQVNRLHQDRVYYNVEAEEMRFITPEGYDDRYIFIDASMPNINIRSMYDELYPEPEEDEVVYIIVTSGATVWSNSTAIPSFDVGDWPAGAEINLEVNGVIVGRGGAGGTGNSGNGNPGAPGGTGLFTRKEINLTISETGIIAGGGGGGGAGGAGLNTNNGSNGTGGVGGAGAGVQNGDNWITRHLGKAGTNPSGGGTSGRGGNGGLIGANGSPGADGTTFPFSFPVDGSNGGAAGDAIDGSSYVTIIDNDGTIAGDQVN